MADEGGAGQPGEVTVMLRRWQAGDMDARDAVFRMLHANLLAVAGRHVASHDGMTLAPADLVNESIVRLLGAQADYRNRTHLMATAALKVRSVLVDHIRARMAGKPAMARAIAAKARRIARFEAFNLVSDPVLTRAIGSPRLRSERVLWGRRCKRLSQTKLFDMG